MLVLLPGFVMPKIFAFPLFPGPETADTATEQKEEEEAAKLTEEVGWVPLSSPRSPSESCHDDGRRKRKEDPGKQKNTDMPRLTTRYKGEKKVSAARFPFNKLLNLIQPFFLLFCRHTCISGGNEGRQAASSLPEGGGESSHE